MKNIIILLLIFNTSVLVGQVGINTTNPQRLFSIDGKSSPETTNPETGVPTKEQQKDDVVVDNKGNVGIGTIDPTAKLEINTDLKDDYGFKLVDGNQGDGKVLTSDANGNGTWNALEIPLYQIRLRNLPDYNHPSHLREIAYTGLNFEVAPGRWLIDFNIGIELTPASESESYIGTNMVRIRLLDTQNPPSKVI